MTVSTGMDHSVVPATKVTLWTKTASFADVRFHNLLAKSRRYVNATTDNLSS